MRRSLLLLVCLFVALNSCQTDKGEGVVLAEVGASKLLLSEVLEQMPAFSSHADSMAYVAEHVDRWVAEELVYQQGTRYLTNYDQLQQQVEEYRRRLVTQSYDRELLRQHAQDLTEEDYRAFYEKYGKQLILSEPIIKGFYVKIPIDKKTKHKKMKEWLKQLSEQNTDHTEELEQYLSLHAVDYDGFFDQWMPLTYVSERLPEQVVDVVSFLKIGLIELTDDDFAYYLHLTDFRLEKEESPYEYALPQIREILLNRHSRDYLRKAHKEMRDYAIETGNLKINTLYTK